jgi:hypothetical protein
LPEPYRHAAQLLGDVGEAWRFVELAWYVDIVTRPSDDPDHVAVLFPELKKRHDALFGTAPLPALTLGRPRKAAWMRRPEAVEDIRWVYEERRREFAATRVTTPGLKHDGTPAERALAWTAKAYGVSPRQLERVIFSKAVTRHRRRGS